MDIRTTAQPSPVFRLTIGPSFDMVSVARHFVCDAFVVLGADARGDEAALLTSETVSNAIRHAQTPITLAVMRTGDRVRVAVHDHDSSSVLRPSPRSAEIRPGDVTPGGHGLHIIDALADDWGVEAVDGDGKVVWFAITVPSAEPAA